VLHDRLRELRRAAGLTQSALADRVEVTRQTIIAIERGGYTPSVLLALKLGRELGVPVDELFWIEDEE
jgi:putative transcriptional regulator